jgi:hypothetical protein
MLFVLSKLARTNYPPENGCLSISSSPCRLRSKMNWHATSPGWHRRTRPSRDDRSAPFVFHRRAVDRGLAEGLADQAARVPGDSSTTCTGTPSATSHGPAARRHGRCLAATTSRGRTESPFARFVMDATLVDCRLQRTSGPLKETRESRSGLPPSSCSRRRCSSREWLSILGWRRYRFHQSPPGTAP